MSPLKADAYLVVNSQIYPLTKKTTTIGRKLGNDIVIQDPLISREHAKITKTSQTYMLQDLNSTSGTYINQNKVSQGELYSGDVILLANVPILFIDEKAGLSKYTDSKTGELKDPEE